MCFLVVVSLEYSERFLAVDDDGLSEDPACSLVCVYFLEFSPSVLPEHELNALVLRGEEFVILHRFIEDEENMLKMMGGCGRVGFVVQC